MFVLFATPLILFPLHLADDHVWAALFTGAFMLLGYSGTLVWGKRWVQQPLSLKPTTSMKHGVVRWCRRFVGNGDLVQSIARWIDPQWKNPYSGQSPQQTFRWLTAMELFHWAALIGSIAPVLAAFCFGYRTFGLAYLLANLLYNIVPIQVVRDSRERLQRIIQLRLVCLHTGQNQKQRPKSR